MTELHLSDPGSFALLCLGLMLGGVLKGATGAGLPVIAVPVIASVFDIRFAVILLVVPNFFTNLWQIIQYRCDNDEPVLTRNFAIAGAVGSGLGTLLLAYLPLAVLSLLAACTVVFYVLLRLLKPSFKLAIGTAKRWVYPVGVAAGSLQGALGISSPISITFLHSIRLRRETFIFTVSVFFAMMSVIQVPVQLWLGLTTVKFAFLSTLALLPILIGLPIGNWFGKRMNAAAFDITILCLLVILAIKMSLDAVSLM